MSTNALASKRSANIALWIVQVLLAALFLFAGYSKLAMPAELLAQGGLPLAFMQFIAVAEILGGLGLVLPGAARIHRELTPIAAAGLLAVMAGATTLTASTMGATAAVVPFVTGLLTACVVAGRWSEVPRRRAPDLHLTGSVG